MKESEEILKNETKNSGKDKGEIDIWKDLRQSMVKKQEYDNAENNFKKKRGHYMVNPSIKKKRSQSEKKLPASKSIMEV